MLSFLNLILFEYKSGYNFYRLLPVGGLLPTKDYSPILTEIYALKNIIAVLKKTYNPNGISK